jgi:hypothetical protein
MLNTANGRILKVPYVLTSKHKLEANCDIGANPSRSVDANRNSGTQPWLYLPSD